MSRPGVDYEAVKHAAVKLLSQGTAPSVQKIREVLCTGSNNTIANHLKIWREEYAQKNIHHLPATLPKELIASFEVLWQTAMEHAQNQLAAYKQSLESERALIIKAQQDAEKNVLEIEQELVDISANLENEIVEKQGLIIELAVANDRLIKKDETFSVQKEHYETHLKRAYEEKENTTTCNHLLQSDIQLLQEKLAIQVEQQQKLLSQQSTQQEQSEMRWLTLIDKANQAAKETNKKLEILRHDSAEQIKNLKDKLTEVQMSYYDKEFQLKAALDQINQLDKAVKALELDNVKANSTIMKLREDIKSNNIAKHPTKLQKKECITEK